MTTTPTALRLVLPDTGTELDLTGLQGLWTEAMYLRLSNQTSRLIEYTDGVLELLPMPTRSHQMILAYLYEQFVAAVRPIGGLVLFAALRLQIHPGKFRAPDLLLLRDERDPRNQEAYWLGADLVVEIVSPANPERDLMAKRADYAEARIPEYWIVDPQTTTITVLTLHGTVYTEHGTFGRDAQATSALLSGLGVVVADVFAAMQQ